MSRWLIAALLYLGGGVAGLYAAFTGSQEGWAPVMVGAAACVGSFALIRGGMLLERARTHTDNWGDG
jgi:hypothetical protein